jgi:hypothetical protein
MYTGYPYPQKFVFKTATPTYYIDPSRHIDGNKRTPFFTHLEKGNLSLARGTLSVFQVNKRIQGICARMFYGMYTFQSFSAESFRTRYTANIGQINTSHIRKLRMDLPFPVKTQPSRKIGKNVRLLGLMSHAKHVEVTTVCERWRYP